MNETIPYISIKPGYVSFFQIPVHTGLSRPATEEQRDNLSKNDHKGLVSDKAKKRICSAVDWLLYMAKDKSVWSEKHKRRFRFKLNFITLTLASPQVHSDNDIKSKLLNQFLIEMRKYHNVRNYVWRAEPQRNGSIHFHIVTDKYIHHSLIRKVWNRIQEKLGYVSRYREAQLDWHKNGFRARPELFRFWPLQKQKQAYQQGMEGNWSDPNSSDVHSLRNVKNVSAYLAKYMSKNEKSESSAQSANPAQSELAIADSDVEQSPTSSNDPKERAIDGKLWGLSTTLSKMKSLILPITNRVREELTTMIGSLRQKVRHYDYYSCLYVNITQWLRDKSSYLYKAIQDYIRSITHPPDPATLFEQIAIPKESPKFEMWQQSTLAL